MADVVARKELSTVGGRLLTMLPSKLGMKAALGLAKDKGRIG